MSLLNDNNAESKMGVFKTSWTNVSNELGVNDALFLAGRYGLAQYIDETDTYTQLQRSQKELDATVWTCSGVLDALRIDVVGDIASFRTEIKYLSPVVNNAGFFNALPKTPQTTAKASKVLDVCDTVIGIWQEVLQVVNPDVVQPVKLANGITLEQFIAKAQALRTAATNRLNAKSAAKTNRIVRNTLRSKLEKVMVQYRQRVIRAFPRDSIHRLNLPVLSDYRGSAPDAVSVTGYWDVLKQEARLVWTACLHPKLSHYEVRACPGTTYNSADDVVVARVPKNALTYETSFGLVAVGSEVSFKVFAVTETGRERGSNAVDIERLAVAQQAA